MAFRKDAMRGELKEVKKKIDDEDKARKGALTLQPVLKGTVQ